MSDTWPLLESCDAAGGGLTQGSQRRNADGEQDNITPPEGGAWVGGGGVLNLSDVVDSAGQGGRGANIDFRCVC